MLTITLRVLILSFGLIYYFLLSSSVFYYSLSCLFSSRAAHVMGEMTLEAMLVVYLNKPYWDEKSRWLQRYNKSDLGAHRALERSYCSRKSPTWTCGSEGFSVSPSALARSVGGSSCSGWRGLALSCRRARTGADVVGGSALAQLC